MTITGNPHYGRRPGSMHVRSGKVAYVYTPMKTMASRKGVTSRTVLRGHPPDRGARRHQLKQSNKK